MVIFFYIFYNMVQTMYYTSNIYIYIQGVPEKTSFKDFRKDWTFFSKLVSSSFIDLETQNLNIRSITKTILEKSKKKLFSYMT